MKKSVINEAHKIMDLMGRVTLTELNQSYLDQILDKINDAGMESLSDYEKMALEKMSNDEDIEPPHSLDPPGSTLRFSPVKSDGQPIGRPTDKGTLSGKPQLTKAKLVGYAELMVSNDKVIFIDGNLDELDKPEEEQQIRMVLRNGEYECKATPVGDEYHIDMKEGSDEEEDDLDFMDMNEYKVFDSGEMNEPLDMANEQMDINEGNAFVGAAKKAKEEGKDSFELNGKTYKVTISKSNEPN